MKRDMVYRQLLSVECEIVSESSVLDTNPSRTMLSVRPPLDESSLTCAALGSIWPGRMTSNKRIPN